jgi:SNF2 family DNA or RNA helicase
MEKGSSTIVGHNKEEHMSGITPRQQRDIKDALQERMTPLEMVGCVDEWVSTNELDRLTFKSASEFLDYLAMLPVERTPAVAHIPMNATRIIVNSAKGICSLCHEPVLAGQGHKALINSAWLLYHAVDQCSAVTVTPEVSYDSQLRDRLDTFVASLEQIEPPIMPDEALFSLSSSKNFDLDFDLKLPLLGYQKSAVEYVRRTRKALVCQDMGLGKTPIGIAIAHMAVQEGHKVAIFVPPNLRYQWMSEIKRFAPWLKVKTISGRKVGKLPKCDVLVVPDSIIEAWQNVIAGKYTSIIVDEAHRFKSEKSARTKALTRIANKIPLDGYCALLSGTIIPNRPSEFISPLRIIGRLDPVFGTKKQFQIRYCDYQMVNGFPNVNGASNVAELNQILRGTCYSRTRKVDVLDDLPPKRRAQLDVELPVSVMKKYRKAEDDFLAWVFETYGNDAFLSASKAPVITEINKLRQLLGEAKVDSAVAHIQSLLESGEQVIAFAYHNSVIKAIKEKFADTEVVSVVGGMTAEAKDRAVQKFTSGKARLFIGQFEAAGVGLNLQCASHVVMVEMPWSPATGTQAEDRAWRYGVKNPVVAWWLTAIDPEMPTIDLRMWQILNNKQETISACLDGWAEDMNAEAGSVTALLLSDMMGV